MFDRVTFTNQTGYVPLIDIGALAEALLFYGHVSIIANTGTIKYLLKRIPPFILLQLIQTERIKIYYIADQVGIQTHARGNDLPLHDLVTFSSPQHTINNVPSEIFYKQTNNKLAARKFAKHVKSINHDLFDQKFLLSSFENFEIIEPTMDHIIHSVAPNYIQANPIRFRIERENKGFIVDTNINFDELNKNYHQTVPKEHSSMTEAYLLSLFQVSQEELFYAGQLNSEIAVSNLSQEIHTLTMNSILNRRYKSEQQIEAFSNLTLDSGHAIREAINSGKVPFADMVKLLDKADKFREWLEKQPADEELIKNYYHAVIDNTWVEKLQGKTTRWGIFTSAGLTIDMLGAGGIGTLTGITLGAFDTFILDKIIGGWKPHNFVEDELSKIISPKENNEK